MTIWLKIFALIGAIATIISIGSIIGLLLTSIRDGIDKIKYNYMIAHRFDKPPTAKCFCRDCNLHREDNLCTLSGVSRYTPANGFCYEAEPNNKER